MSASKYAYIPSKCDGDYCPGDCDGCRKECLCPPGMNEENDCAPCSEICEECWAEYRKEKT